MFVFGHLESTHWFMVGAELFERDLIRNQVNGVIHTQQLASFKKMVTDKAALALEIQAAEVEVQFSSHV